MTEADNIVAAIFAVNANMCAGKNCDRATYLQTYDEFINSMKECDKAKKPLNVGKEVLDRANAMRPRRKP